MLSDAKDTDIHVFKLQCQQTKNTEPLPGRINVMTWKGCRFHFVRFLGICQGNCRFLSVLLVLFSVTEDKGKGTHAQRRKTLFKDLNTGAANSQSSLIFLSFPLDHLCRGLHLQLKSPRHHQSESPSSLPARAPHWPLRSWPLHASHPFTIQQAE